MKKLILLIPFIAVLAAANAQDVEDVLGHFKEKPLKINGGLSAQQVFYSVSGIENRKQPYSLFLNGNLTFSVFGWAIPLSVSYSNQDVAYKHPFQQSYNQLGIAPSYKWVKVYAGYNSMNFTPYTLAGHQFCGGGIELTPEGKFQFAFMYGRLRQAVQADTAGHTEPMYSRMGYGFKISVLPVERSRFDLTLFTAADDPNSLTGLLADEEILPGENLVLSLGWQTSLGKKLSLTGEYAQSALTRDLRSGTYSADDAGVFRYTGFIMPTRATTSFQGAFKAGIDYSAGVHTIGLAYERVAPEFTSFGTYYMTNNFSNMTINTASALFNGKLNLALNVGLQKDNIQDDQASATNQMVAMANLTYSPSGRLNFNASYSNFNTFTRVRSDFDYINSPTPDIVLDTLDFTQVSTTITGGMNVMLTKPEAKKPSHTLNCNLNYQRAASQQASQEAVPGSEFLNANAGYNFTTPETGWNAALMFNVGQNTCDSISTVLTGPSLSVGKLLMKKKLRLQISSAYNSTQQNGALQYTVLSTRFTAGLSVKEKHNLQLSAVYLQKASKISATKAFNEFTGTLGYTFNF